MASIEGSTSSARSENFSRGPHAPEEPRGMSEYEVLSSMKDALTKGATDAETIKEVGGIIERWKNEPSSVEPFTEMRNMLERARALPRGTERVTMMNSIVRTLGEPKVLATFLDMLRDSAERAGSREQSLCQEKLQNVKLHSIYGWCGNTLMVESLYEPTEGTAKVLPGLGEKLGNSPSAWNLTVHIWQPNISAQGFPVEGIGLKRGTIVEPPHSHPFDFVSRVVTGAMHQSLYVQPRGTSFEANGNTPLTGRYSQIPLEHVDGVWPPHDYRETCSLTAIERVLLTAGDSYYMPCDWIHDVEIDGTSASSEPTITLFLSSEYMVIPHVYMTKEMADFQDQHPDIKKNGAPIPENAWHEKLKAISAYLRGDSRTLDLNSIVKYNGEYAFFHVNSEN